jgi:hypothetical protein
MIQQDTLQKIIERFTDETMLDWSEQDRQEALMPHAHYVYIFLGVLILFVGICWLWERRKNTSSVIAVAISTLALASCNTTYHATTEQPFVAGNSLGIEPSDATIKIGRKTAVISQGDVKTVPLDSVTISGNTITVGFTDRIKVVYTK